MVTQGTFAFLPDLDDEEILAQLDYAVSQGWAVSIEFTDDPHPGNTFWEMWGLPLFDLDSPKAALAMIRACREAQPGHYVKVNAFDSRKGRETVALSFLVQRPATEPGFRIERSSGPGRTVGYRLHPYSSDRPLGERYN